MPALRTRKIAFFPFCSHRFSREIEVSYLGPIPILVFILAVPCLVCVVTWLLTKSWILNNVLAFSLIIFFLTSVRLSSLKVYYKFTEVPI